MKELRIASAGGVAAALAAIVLSSCCALPMALVFIGVSTSVVGLLGPLHSLRPAILLLAAGSLGLGWFLAVRRRSSRAYPVLALGTILFALSFLWETWDPILQRLVMQTLNS